VAVLADDSGLRSIFRRTAGIRSARYAGTGASDKENWLKLLKELDGVPGENGAPVSCAVALVWPDGGKRSRGEASRG
jgi:XTP/dITP diphosphohydrolase